MNRLRTTWREYQQQRAQVRSWPYLTPQLEDETPICQAICRQRSYHGRPALLILTTKRILRRLSYTHGTGFGGERAWVDLADVLAVTRRSSAMFIVMPRPMAQPKELRLQADVLVSPAPEADRFFNELARLMPERVASPSVLDDAPVGELAPIGVRADELQLLRALLPAGSTGRQELEAAYTEVVSWHEKYGPEAVARRVALAEQEYEAQQARLKEAAEHRRARMQELYAKHGIDPATRLPHF